MNPSTRTNTASRPINHWMDTGMGKLPPQAIDVEEVVLGALLIESKALDVVSGILRADSFYKEAHQHIYSAIASLAARREPIDLMTVTQKLRDMGKIELIGGGGYISELTFRVNSSANIEYHARIVQQMYLKRQLIIIASNILREAYEDVVDVFELLSKTEQAILALNTQLRPIGEVPFDQQLHLMYKQGVALSESGKLPGIPSAYHEINKLTGGYQGSKLYYFGARPAMGKSLFMINEAITIAYAGYAVALFTLEMNFVEQNQRIVSLATSIDHEEIKMGTAYKDDAKNLLIQNKIDELGKLRFYQYDEPGIKLAAITTKLRKLKSEGNLDMAFIDYLTLMQSDDISNARNRSEEVGEISKGLKRLSGELGIPIFVLLQLSRAVETRGGDKKPQLSDLRESGDLEQDGDLVGFLYRPEYYGITQDENGNPTNGLLQVIIEKQRGGALGTVNLTFQPKISSIIDHTHMVAPVTNYYTTFPDKAAQSFSEPLKEGDEGF